MRVFVSSECCRFNARGMDGSAANYLPPNIMNPRCNNTSAPIPASRPT